MESNSQAKSKKARERWKFLANVLTKNNNEDNILNNPVSVRRFPGFGLFKAVERKNCDSTNFDFQIFEYFCNADNLDSARVEISVR